MAKSAINPKADFYFRKSIGWKQELETLRAIVLETGLTEEVKWGVPCYTFEGTNIVLLHVFKEYCAILFHKGALLQDMDGVLIQQTKNTQSARQIRFTNTGEIIELKRTIKAYIKEAIDVEKAGLKVEFKKTAEYTMPAELEKKLSEMPKLKKAFNALTPGRQRGYILYFAEPKQSKTRESRIEKYMQQILDGKGLRD